MSFLRKKKNHESYFRVIMCPIKTWYVSIQKLKFYECVRVSFEIQTFGIIRNVRAAVIFVFTLWVLSNPKGLRFTPALSGWAGYLICRAYNSHYKGWTWFLLKGNKRSKRFQGATFCNVPVICRALQLHSCFRHVRKWWCHLLLCQSGLFMMSERALIHYRSLSH